MSWKGTAPENMDEDQVIAELTDVLDRNDHFALECYNMIRDIREDGGFPRNRTRSNKLLAQARNYYPEFIPDRHAPPMDVFRASKNYAHLRPGWAELWR